MVAEEVKVTIHILYLGGINTVFKMRLVDMKNVCF